MSPEVAVNTNPFPGLRPFKEDEEYLFFGRESQVDAMVDKLAATHFLAVVGPSGSGKSSLVNCGLRPALHGGLMTSAGSAWHIVQFRPGGNPFTAMAQALANREGLFANIEPSGLSLAKIVETTLRMSKRGLLEIYQQARLAEHVNLLVVVDQFEELFRYGAVGASQNGQIRGVSEDAVAFVNLLLEVRERAMVGKKRKKPPVEDEATTPDTFRVYVAITMRSDFLGDCAQFHGLPEAINDGEYLVPRMSREERRAAIAGPIAVSDAQITPVLLTRLVNDVGDNPDQLSILQHALNRTWAHWENVDQRRGPIDLPHYEAIGTMARALDQHAEKAYAELGNPDEKQSRKQKICEKIFKALTDKGTDVRGIRRPTKLGTLCALADAGEAEVVEVIDVFRKPSRSFLMPPVPEVLDADSKIDISHESLMRVWEHLKLWADEEAESARMYRRLAVAAGLYAAGQASLWRDPELQLADDWRKENQPTEAWAQRYHPGFDGAIGFLEESLALRAQEAAAAEARRQHELEQAKALAEAQRLRAEEQRKRFRIAAVLAFLAVGLAVLALFFWFTADAQRAAAETARQDAEEQRQIAVREKEEADRQRLLADSNATVAQLERMAADEQRELAQVNFLSAERQRRIAERLLDSLGVAQEELRVALDSAEARRQEAERQRTIAEEALAVAEEQRAIAESERTKTLGLSLASRAKRRLSRLDIAMRNALLAREAFLFSESSDGEFISEVYDALRSTLNDLSDIQNVPQRGGPTEQGTPHDDWVKAIAYSGNWIASSGLDGTLYLRQADNANAEPIRLRVPSDPANPIARPLAFSPDGLLASVGDRETLRLWNTASQDARGRKLGDHPGEVRALAFNRDGATLASAGDDGAVRVWTKGSLSGVLRDSNGSGAVHAVAFSPTDASLLAAAGKDGKVRLWNADTGALLQTLRGHQGAVRAAAFSPTNGALLATAGDDDLVRLWDVVQGQEIGVLRGHVGPVNVVAFSPDGTRLASGSGDQQVRLWDVSDLSNLTRHPLILEGHTAWVESLAFSPDGTTLVSGSADRTVLQWNIDVEALADAVCEAVGYEDLSEEDWQIYVPGVPYRTTCSQHAPASPDTPTNGEASLGQIGLGSLPGGTTGEAVRRERPSTCGCRVLIPAYRLQGYE